MVAEPVQETEQPASEIQEIEAPESAPPVVEEIPDEAIDGFLKDQGLLTTEGDNGSKAPVHDDGPSLDKLTPQQAFEQGKQSGKPETEADTLSKQAAYQRQQRINGARYSVNNSGTRLVQYLEAKGLDATSALEAKAILDEVHGHWNLLYQGDMESATTTVKSEFKQTVEELAVSTLGTKGDAFLKEWRALPADKQGTPAFFNAFAEAARDGLKTPAEVDSEFRSRFSSWVKKLPKDARDALGFNPSSTGTAQNAAGVGTNRGTLEWALTASPAELLADKARRAAAGQ